MYFSSIYIGFNSLTSPESKLSTSICSENSRPNMIDFDFTQAFRYISWYNIFRIEEFIEKLLSID